MCYYIEIQYGIEIDLLDFSNSRAFYDIILKRKESILQTYEGYKHFCKWISKITKNSYEYFKSQNTKRKFETVKSFLEEWIIYFNEDFSSEYFETFEQCCDKFESEEDTFDDSYFEDSIDYIKRLRRSRKIRNKIRLSNKCANT